MRKRGGGMWMKGEVCYDSMRRGVMIMNGGGRIIIEVDDDDDDDDDGDDENR